MSWLFGLRKKPEKSIAKQQKALNRTIREIDRAKKRMERDEIKLISEIRKAANGGQMETVKILARDLVRTRRFVKKFVLLRANIQAIILRVETTKSQFVMTQATRGVCIALQTMNRQLNLPLVARILQQFSKQTGSMDLKDEAISDEINWAMDVDGDDDESDAVIMQVLDELKLHLSDQLSGLPQASSSISQELQNRSTTMTQATPQTVEESTRAADIDASIQERLNRLRRN